jgi:hypothetical protein
MAGAVAPNYGLGASELAKGALGTHLKGFEAWLRQPVNLERSAAHGALAPSSADGTIRHISGCLGFISSKDGMDVLSVQQLGLLALLHGPSLMSFIAYLLRERGVALTTCVKSVHSLIKARHQLPSASPVGVVGKKPWCPCAGCQLRLLRAAGP